MKNVAKGVTADKQERTDQAGITLVELVVAIALSALLLVGSVVILHHMLVVSAENADRTIARLQAQYVAFWIGEDVVQAQTISVCDSGNCTGGFPLTMGWTTRDEDETLVEYHVEYRLIDSGEKLVDSEENAWMLVREHKRNGLSNGNVTVAEFLIPWKTGNDYCNKDEGLQPEGTWCAFCPKGCTRGYETDGATCNILRLKVTARVDVSEASSTYEIHPRGNVCWE